MPYIDLASPEVIGKVVKNLNNRPYRIVDNTNRKSSNNKDVPAVIALDTTNGDWERFYYDGKPERSDRSPLNLFEEESSSNIKMVVGRTYITKNYIKVFCEEFITSGFSFSLFNKSYRPNTYRVTALEPDVLGSILFRSNWLVDENGVAVEPSGQDILDVYTPSSARYYWVYVPNSANEEPWKDLSRWKGAGLNSLSENNWEGFIEFNSRPSLYQTPLDYTLVQVAIQETRFNLEEFKLLSYFDSPAPVLPAGWTSPFSTLNIQGWTLQSAPVSSLGTVLNSQPVISAPVHSVNKFIIAQVQYSLDVWLKSIDTLNCEFGYSDDGVVFKSIENNSSSKFYWQYSLDGIFWTDYGLSFLKTTITEEEWSGAKEYEKDTVVSYAGAKFKALQKITSTPVNLAVVLQERRPIKKGEIVQQGIQKYVALTEIFNFVHLETYNNPAAFAMLPASPAVDTARWVREPSTTIIEKTAKARFLRLVLEPEAGVIPSSPPTGADRRYLARLNSAEIKLIQS